MTSKKSNLFIAGIILIICQACNQPRVIEAQSANTAKAEITANSIPALQEMGKTSPIASAHNHASPAEHKVVVQEVLNTEKYTYMNVLEEGEKRWIAIPKNDIEVGATYYYSGGLLKKNFYSREYDRVFETIYLVSKIWQEKPTANKESALEEAISRTKAGAALNVKVGKIESAEGAITIAELFKNKSKYSNQKVKITGKCVKVNPKIMGRNWIHLQDGSGEELDLTITTAQDIPLGAVLTLEGTIALDKDFGSGYRYDIIMEEAEMAAVGSLQ